MGLHDVLDVVSAALMLAGGLSCLLGALGLVRLPDCPPGCRPPPSRRPSACC
ncbi:hypothetical protein [Pseudonocardia sp. ICBG601]|uniref:hypothetical protein n=1 Tax=Pseudonocardia sp. ICBG601 TaxID=2846759 RepID=UPI0027E2529C|nr:hypothetical protein [Pseudonocardia sp. ICBG601]